MQPQSQAGFPPNTVIHGRYLIVRMIGRGGMGAVYEAVDQRLGATVALKQMTVSGANLSAAFEREAHILASLRHSSLPKVSDFFSDGQAQFLVMEFIPGTDLGTLLAQRGRPFPVEDVLRWADQSLAVLEYLHVQSPPIIHRDIKPQNMKLTPAGEIVLLDFGLAKSYAAAQSATTGSIFAYTPNYAPLEQVQGTGTTPSSDLYALSATLYQLLTGATPSDVLQRLGATASGQPDPLRPASELNPQVPPPVAQWIARGLQIDQRGRPPSAEMMRADLQQIQRAAISVANTGPTVLASSSPAAAFLPTGAPAAPPPAPSAGTRRRAGPATFIIIALVALLAGAGGLAVWLLGGRPPGGGSLARTPVTQAVPTRIPTPTNALLPSDLPLPTTAGPNSTQAINEPPPADIGLTAMAGLIGTEASGPQFGPLGPQSPIHVSASGAAPDGVDSAGNITTFGPENVADGNWETAWRVPGNGDGQFLGLSFAGPVRIRQVQIIPGYAKIDPITTTDRFFQNRRVRRARLVFSDGSSVDATFSDAPTLQAVNLPQPVISSYLQVEVLETTDPGAVDGRDFTPISEIVVIGEVQSK